MMIPDMPACLLVRSSQQALAFCREALGATEWFRLSHPSGRIGHMEIDFDA